MIPQVTITPFYKNPLGIKHGKRALWLVKDESNKTLAAERSMTEALKVVDDNGYILRTNNGY